MMRSARRTILSGLVLMFAAPALAQTPAPRPPTAPPKLADLARQYEAEKSLPYAKRYQTIGRFGQVRTDECARFVEKIYRGDGDQNVRRYALNTLGSIGTPHARSVLVQVLEDAGSDASLKSSALNGLTRCTPPPDRAIFLKYSSKEQPYILRLSAIRGLARFADLESYKALVSFLAQPAEKDNEQLQVNRTVLQQLSVMKVPAGIDYLVEEILKAPRGKAIWHKRALLPLVFKSGKAGELFELFLELTEEKDEPLRLAAIDGLDGDPLRDEAVARLIDLLKGRSDPVATAAAAMLGKRGPPEALEPLLKASTSKGQGRSTAAIEALGAYPDDDKAGKRLEKALKKRKPWQAVAAAIAGLERRRRKDSIDVLVKVLPKLDGRLFDDARRALERMTGQDFGDKAKDWKSWWARGKDIFEFSGAAARREATGRDKPEVTTVTRNPKYYGSEVVSRRLAFIVDFSGSMTAKMDMKDANSKTRLDRAKEELVAVIKGLTKDAHFNLVFFGTDFKAWQKTIVRATGKARSSALGYISGGKTMGGTNIYDPLEAVLQDPNVDTIYLLSDGSPGSGKFTAPADILREIKKINAGKRIVIHTISFGSKSAFMKDLAEQNGGKYIER